MMDQEAIDTYREWMNEDLDEGDAPDIVNRAIRKEIIEKLGIDLGIEDTEANKDTMDEAFEAYMGIHPDVDRLYWKRFNEYHNQARLRLMLDEAEIDQLKLIFGSAPKGMYWHPNFDKETYSRLYNMIYGSESELTDEH